jgi:aflatoxin B1 aldehyde reductase
MFSLRYDAVRRQAVETMALLDVDKLDIFYLHGVDPATSIEETLRAVNDLHREGIFKRFGLSNYPAWQVVQVYYLCQRLGYVVPTVSVTTWLYQGQPSPPHR